MKEISLVALRSLVKARHSCECWSMIWALLCLASISVSTFARTEVFELSLSQAEKETLASSNQLKAARMDQDAATEQASAQFQSLLPKLAFQASYQYYGTIPTITLGPGLPIPFGTHSSYALGPSVSYTLWDSFSGRNAYRAYSLLEQAREEDRKTTALQLLLSIRSAYIQVQLGNDELRLIHDSLELAKAQEHDVSTRYRAGAATRLDLVTAQRSVLNYEIQFKQRQAELAASFKDFLALLGKEPTYDISRPGPSGIPGVTLTLKLESLRKLIEAEALPSMTPPGEDQPQIRSQVLQSESLEKSARSQSAKSYPTLLLSAGVSLNRPNIPNPPSYWQETIGVSLSVPLFLGDPSRHLAAQQRDQSDAAGFRAQQLRINLQRDFVKARELLDSFRDQRVLAARDIVQSEDAARLYYVSYQAGKINLIDVQNANLQALQSKVGAARIDAQILNQIVTLKAISAQELSTGAFQ